MDYDSLEGGLATVKGWGLTLVFVLGLALGVAGTVSGPRLARPYLPEALRGPTVTLEGTVTAKRKEPTRVLLTLLTAQGAILATFKRNVTEIDLLVEQGDIVTVALRRYEPFVDDPVIERVRKVEPTSRPAGREPGPLPPDGESPKEPAPR